MRIIHPRWYRPTPLAHGLIVNIMGADVLATQGARATAPMILTITSYRLKFIMEWIPIPIRRCLFSEYKSARGNGILCRTEHLEVLKVNKATEWDWTTINKTGFREFKSHFGGKPTLIGQQTGKHIEGTYVYGNIIRWQRLIKNIPLTIKLFCWPS